MNEKMENVGDVISRQAAIDATTETVFVEYEENADKEESIIRQTKEDIRDRIKALPTVRPTQEIIHCKDCKHWNLQVGNVKGDGLGSCDFHNVNLVTGEGYCYWADRRDEAE